MQLGRKGNIVIYDVTSCHMTQKNEEVWFENKTRKKQPSESIVHDTQEGGEKC